MTRQVAIAIGVSRSVAGAPLPGALNGVKRFAKWAKNSGFSVIRFTDAKHPVDATKIKATIKSAVETGDVSRLFIFFAGHGVSLGAGNDVWLLSGADDDAEAAINVPHSLLMAQRSGIRHVAIFADACRTPPSHQHDGIRGATLFPTKPRQGRVELDRFYATRTSDPALEIQRRSDPPGTAFGVFTECLLDIFEGKIPASLKSLSIEGRQASVILARTLADEIGDIVADRLIELKVTESQEPESIPGSSPPNFLAELPRQERPVMLTVTTTEARPPYRPLTDGSSITIAVYVPESNGETRFRSVKSGGSPLVVEVSAGTLCRIEARVHGWRPADDRDQRIIEVSTDVQEAVRFVSGTLHSRRSAWSDEAHLRSNIVDREGHVHARAPASGIYTVETLDPLTGLRRHVLQTLRKGERPTPAPPPPGQTERLATIQRSRVRRIVENTGRQDYETDTGLSVYGATPVAAHVSGGHLGLFQEQNAWHVRGRPALERMGASVVLELSNARFAAAAMFANLVGAITITANTVESLMYVPSIGVGATLPNSLQDLLREMIARATVAAGGGRFTIDAQSANQTAKKLRQYKHENPTLGVLAAYAYAEAGNIAEIDDMVGWFEKLEQAVPYDVVMLSTRPPESLSVARCPAFPMLTRGWAYLDRTNLHPAIAAARASLAPSLFALATGDGGRKLAAAVAGGELP